MSEDKEIKLDATASFLFTAMLKCCLTVKKLGRDKHDFIKFCEGSWDIMEMKDPEKLNEAVFKIMRDDIKRFEVEDSYEGMREEK